ncbi:MAG: hypothetical protein PHP46_06825 [Candidatus Omnitrophica bacterium]|nr:hypothetical protein [Candidatus Omnitrophota bacterium]
MRLVSLVAVVCVAIALVGCEKISKPYIMTVDRVDQKVDAGNRGYLVGTPPPADERSGLKRPLIAVDMDLVSIQGKASQQTTIVSKSRAATPVAVMPSTVEESVSVREEQIK